MKLFKVEGDTWVFRLSRLERSMFLQVLEHYPLIPPAHHRLSRQAAPVAPDAEALLQQSLAEEKAASRRQLDLFLANDHKFHSDTHGCRLSLTREEIEWLLQILNDVRVGCWLQLGCPDPDEGKPPVISDRTAPCLLPMEIAGHLQCALLEALGGRGAA
jgi:hypothetical protein